MPTEDQHRNSEDQPHRLTPYQFTPGQSGNPAGRPKGRSLTARLRDIVERSNGTTKDIGDAVMEVLVKSALKGDMKAMALLLDRVDGKVIQQFQQVDSGLAKALEIKRERERSRAASGPSGDVPE